MWRSRSILIPAFKYQVQSKHTYRRWTREECEVLRRAVHLAPNQKMSDWTPVLAELNWKRSTRQCASKWRYLTLKGNHQKSLALKPWRDHDEALLISLRDICENLSTSPNLNLNDFKPEQRNALKIMGNSLEILKTAAKQQPRSCWAFISRFFPGRSPQAVRSHYKRLIERNNNQQKMQRGPWSFKEHFCLLKWYHLHPNDWPQIAQNMADEVDETNGGKRTAGQCYWHWHQWQRNLNRHSHLLPSTHNPPYRETLGTYQSVKDLIARLHTVNRSSPLWTMKKTTKRYNWTQEELDWLVHAVHVLGKQWQWIEELLNRPRQICQTTFHRQFKKHLGIDKHRISL